MVQRRIVLVNRSPNIDLEDETVQNWEAKVEELLTGLEKYNLPVQSLPEYKRGTDLLEDPSTIILAGRGPSVADLVSDAHYRGVPVVSQKDLIVDPTHTTDWYRDRVSLRDDMANIEKFMNYAVEREQLERPNRLQHGSTQHSLLYRLLHKTQIF